MLPVDLSTWRHLDASHRSGDLSGGSSPFRPARRAQTAPGGATSLAEPSSASSSVLPPARGCGPSQTSTSSPLAAHSSSWPSSPAWALSPVSPPGGAGASAVRAAALSSVPPPSRHSPSLVRSCCSSCRVCWWPSSPGIPPGEHGPGEHALAGAGAFFGLTELIILTADVPGNAGVRLASGLLYLPLAYALFFTNRLALDPLPRRERPAPAG